MWSILLVLLQCESVGNGSNTLASVFLPSVSKATTSSSASGGFHKRCPFCCLLFRTRQSLLDHLPSKHPQFLQVTGVDIDALPNADDVPALLPNMLAALTQSVEIKESALDLSGHCNGSKTDGGGDRESLSMSPFPTTGTDTDEPQGDTLEELAMMGFPFGNMGQSGSQLALSKSPTSNKRYRTHLTPLQVHVSIMDIEERHSLCRS